MRTIPFLLLLACTSAPGETLDTQPPVPEPLVAFVARHAEVQDGGGANPHLSEAGSARAAALAERVAEVPLAAVFSTDYHRTRETAQPAATAHGLSLDTSHEPLSTELSDHVLSQHAEHEVLIVGHSNTVPAILGELGMAEPPEIGEEVFGDLWILTRTSGGEVTVGTERYGVD